MARISPRALLPPALRNQLENSNRVIAVTRKIQRYGQRHIRSDSVSFYVLSLHQHQRPLRTRQACGRERCRGRFEARLPFACAAAEMGPRARNHRRLIEAPPSNQRFVIIEYAMRFLIVKGQGGKPETAPARPLCQGRSHTGPNVIACSFHGSTI